MFSDQFLSCYEELQTNKTKSLSVKNILSKGKVNFNDFQDLISDCDLSDLRLLAASAAGITLKRFGKTMNFYVPLYLSNQCDSKCVYCGFSSTRKINRVTMNSEKMIENFQFLQQKGFDNILLVTGESRKHFGVQKILNAVNEAKKYFSFVGIEVFPMNVDEYKSLVDAGCDGVTVYQETYNHDVYQKMHIAGEKKDYIYRLNTPDRALQAGFRKVGIGALLGLADPEFEMKALAKHVEYLQKKYWKSEISVSFPRIQPENILSRVPCGVTDKKLVQFICALRVLFEDVGFVLSTRENAEVRNNLFTLGITQISAGSSTSPDGYLGGSAGKQFSVADERDLDEMINVIKNKGLDPVLKDWSPLFTGVNS